jgi:superfamily II DNA or RNA helicase
VWTLLDTERGAHCTAVHLARELEPDRTSTLLVPFDRVLTCDHLDTPAVLPPRQWCKYVKHLGATSHPAGSLRALPSARVDLLPHQLEPALAVVRLGATHLLIADGVGLGKTIQAGLIAAELAVRVRSMRALILVPAGLRDQWKHELARHFDLTCTTADAAWVRDTAADRPVGANPWALPGMFLASIDFVKRAEVLRPLEEVEWDLLVLDEAHAASAHSDRRTAAHALAIRSRVVVLLTATPPADDPRAYAALCNIGRIDAGESPAVSFRRTQTDIGARSPRKSRLLAVRPSEAETRMHSLLDEYTRRVWRESTARGDMPATLAAIVLRKRALSSAASLAASIRRRIELLNARPGPAVEQLRLPMWEEEPLEDEAPASVLAAPGLGNAALECRWLALIAEAAQRAAASETKIRFVVRMLRRVREPVIVFTEYRDTLLRLEQALSGGTRAVRLLHGGMHPSDRTSVQQEFNAAHDRGRPGSTGQCLVLLATDAAAEGLNLHERCRTVIHFELPWSTARLEQRAGRVDRLGQRRRVHETGLIAATGAERLVLAPLMRRALHAHSTGAGPQGLPAALSESHVAHMIIGGDTRLDSSRAPSPPLRTSRTRTVSLQAAAREEADRAGSVRGLFNPSPDGARPPQVHRTAGSAIRRRRSALRPGVILVFRLALSSRISRVHAEAIVVWLPRGFVGAGTLSDGLAGRSPKAASVRTIVEQVQANLDGRVADAVAAHVRRALEHALHIERTVGREWSRRDELTRSARIRAARQLVQGGLFERRRPGVDGPGGAALDQHDYDPRSLANILSVDVRLAAALLVRA